LSFFNDIGLFLVMRKSTNKLTKHELNFARDKTYPLVKHDIVQKINNQFQELGQKLVQQLSGHELVSIAEFKITRGENFQLMPYMVLDFPKINGKEFSITCRTLFWWGHYFSCNLVIQTRLLDVEQTASSLVKMKKVRILRGENLWEHDIKNADYVKIHTLTQQEIIQLLEEQTYLKLAVGIDIEKAETLLTEAPRYYAEWLSRICIKKG
jgi:hypothetical protein